MNNQERVDHMARESLRLLGKDPENWVRSIAGVDHDVAIVGGGQSGITIAFALRRAGISSVTVLEAADEANTGVWLTRARMNTLRTEKTRSGLELGNPALGFQAWYEGLHGKDAFEAIGRIARTDWAEYLKWFQRQVNVNPRYKTRLIDLEPAGEHLRLHLELGNGDRVVETARKVVFATGMGGSGGPAIPAIFNSLSRARYAHTGEQIPFARLAGKSVGVLGAASSALDAAATAGESGATEVHLFSYRSQLNIAPEVRTAQSAGAQDNFHHQTDAVRWKNRIGVERRGANSPLDSVLRAVALPNFYLHLDAPWKALREEDDQVVVTADDGTHRFDFVIAGTGYQHDPGTRQELKGISEYIALWEDVYEPPVDLRSENLGKFPYLGPAYELTEKNPGSAPWLANIHFFSTAAIPSFGRPVGDIPSIRTEVPRLVTAISRDLFLSDQRLPSAPKEPTAAESNFDRYAHAIWRPDSNES